MVTEDSSQPPQSNPDPLPSLAHYEIEERIGTGPLAAVYRAYRPTLGKYVALKMLRPEFAGDDEAVQCFERSGHIAERLRHPNILPVYDVGREGGQSYIVMEDVSGPSLEHWIQEEGALAPQEALTILRQVADALEFAHAEGVLHLNLKPTNVLLAPSGQALVDDWCGRTESERVSRAGDVAHTYTAPELLAGRTVDQRADVYSLGALAYHMLCGQPPARRAAGRIAAPSALNRKLPKAVDRVLLRAMDARKEKRFQSASAFVEALGRALAVRGGRSLREALILPLGSPWPRRLAFGALVVILAFGCGFILWSTNLLSPVPVQPTFTTVPSQTPSPTQTSTPSPTPTSTPVPTASPTLAPTVTPEPTMTMTPVSTATVASYRPMASITPIPLTPTPTLAPAPILQSPTNNVSVSGGRVHLRWDWLRPLRPGEHFDVRVWRAGQPHNGVAWVDATTYDYVLQEAGDYYWSVAVLRELGTRADGSRLWEAISQESAVWVFAYYPPLRPGATPSPTLD